MKSLKINFESQLKNWNQFFVLTLIFLGGGIYFYFTRGSKGLFVFYVFVAIQFLFTAYLSFRYYQENKGKEFIIHDDKIIKIENGISQIHNVSDISKIVICKSANMDKGGMPFSTFETFRIARVYLKGGDSFILTNALEYDIEIPLSILKDVKFERRKGFSFFI